MTGVSVAQDLVYFGSDGEVIFIDPKNPGRFAEPEQPSRTLRMTGLSFNVTYDDVTTNTNVGFDDPTEGAVRQATVEAVLSYIHDVLKENTGATIDVRFNLSQTDGTDFLAAAGPVWVITDSTTFSNGAAFDHITTGSDPAPSSVDMSVTVDFGYNWQSDYNQSPSPTETDLYTVILHELTHGLGILSNSDMDGKSEITGDNPGFYSVWDKLMRFDDSGVKEVIWKQDDPDQTLLQQLASIFISDNLFMSGSNATAAFGSEPPVYAPTSYESGSSLSHFKTGTVDAVMEHATPAGIMKRYYTAVDIGALVDIGYTNAAAPGAKFEWASAPGGVNGRDIALDSAGNIYTTHYSVRKLDPNGALLWASAENGTGRSIAVDSAGNVYTTAHNADSVVRKRDPSGAILWSTPIGGVGLGIAVDSAGNVYTISSLDSFSDIFMQKLDPNGALLWADVIVSASQNIQNRNIGWSVAVDSAGNIYTTGFFRGTADFDPGPGVFNLTQEGDADMFVQKLDPNGAFLWVSHIGGTGIQSGYDIALDSAGNIYTTRYTVRKLDPNGVLLWARADGGIGRSIAVDSSGNVYTTGYFYLGNQTDFFVRKLDTHGTLVWAIAIGATGDEFADGITVDSAGNVYTTGYFQFIVDFDPGPGVFNLGSAASLSRNMFVLKLSQGGLVGLDEVFVDFSIPTNGTGSESSPFNNLADAVAAANPGATVHIAPETSDETFAGTSAIAKPLSLINSNPAGGSVFIGQSVSRSDSRSGFISVRASSVGGGARLRGVDTQ